MATLALAKKFDAFNAYPENLTILGLDRPAVAPDHLLAKANQPLRLAQVAREGTVELETAIEAVGEVLVPITLVKWKLVAPGVEMEAEEFQVVVWGRRRVIACRAVNKRRVAAGLEPLTVKAILGNPHDPLLYEKVRAENAGRLAEDPLDMAADVITRLAAGKTHEQVGAAYGKSHQWSRQMETLITKGSDKVKAYLRDGRIGTVSAAELSTIGDPAAQDEALAKMEAAGDLSTKAAKAHKSAVKGNRAAPQGGTNARPRKTREIRHTMVGLDRAIAAERLKGKQVALTALRTALAWVLAEEHPKDGEEPFAMLMEAWAIGEGEAKGIDGKRAKDTGEAE